MINQRIQFQIGLIQKCLEHYSALGFIERGRITCCLIVWFLYVSIITKQQDNKYWISDDSQFFALYIVWCWWLIVSYYLIITQTRPLSACNCGVISLKWHTIPVADLVRRTKKRKKTQRNHQSIEQSSCYFLV